MKPITLRSDKEISEDIASPYFSCTEKDARAYLAGYVTYKLKDKAPQLLQETTVSDFSQPWIDKVSLGFLTKPSSTWFNTCLSLEQHFIRTLNNDIHKNPLKTLMDSLELLPLGEQFLPAINLYYRCRIAIRVRSLNKELLEEKQVKQKQRKLSHVLGHTK